MASEVQVLVVDPPAGSGPALTAQAQRRLAQLEARWSRFRPGSELSGLNRAAPGAEVVVSADTCRLVLAMVAGHAATDGRFDPTMLRQILAAGYTASIDDPRVLSISVPGVAADADLRLISVDLAPGADRGSVRLPPGLALDPGGIGKGLAADLVAAELVAAGAAGALVSIGGDLAATGRPPSPDGWLVAVEDPACPDRELATLALDRGGVATSSTRSRRWPGPGGRMRHHVLDPATGTPSATDLAAATVVAPTAWEAEVHATAALVAGSAAGLAHLSRLGLDGLLVTAAGPVRWTPGLAPEATEAVEVAA